jgi:hypothetical protein
VKEFDSNRSCVRSVKNPMLDGTGPPNWLDCRVKADNLVKFPMKESEPVREFTPRCKFFSLDSNEKEEGTEPVNRFVVKEMEVNFVKPLIKEGIEPTKEFDEIEMYAKFVREARFDGREPSILFPQTER